jgi:hypothetical protein
MIADILALTSAIIAGFAAGWIGAEAARRRRIRKRHGAEMKAIVAAAWNRPEPDTITCDRRSSPTIKVSPRRLAGDINYRETLDGAPPVKITGRDFRP